jgi:hypothetical protein
MRGRGKEVCGGEVWRYAEEVCGGEVERYAEERRRRYAEER